LNFAEATDQRQSVINASGSEFVAAPLGDRRLQRRLKAIGDAVATDPDATFPNAMGSSGELEGLYRFLNNRRVAPEAILQPHVAATVNRVAKQKHVAVVHDSTNFVFDGPAAESMGFIPTTTQRGFLGHFALAVTDDGRALGALHVETMFFENYIRGVIRKNRSAATLMYVKRKDKASLRWDRGIAQTRAVLPTDTVAIHIMDREADNYRLFASMVAGGDRFIVRAKNHRRARPDADEPWQTIGDVAKSATYVCKRKVPLSRRRRNPHLNATHKGREARVATLEISATPAIVKRPGKWYVGAVPSLSLNLVRVLEVGGPRGGELVEWMLLTTLPISTREEVERIVDWYRQRWVIEELFRALKTGCAFERRQLESRAALLRTLSLLVPIAWQLLALRDTARRAPKEPARRVLRDAQLVILRKLTNNKLARSPSIEDAMVAIAGQGGHLKRNGRPGWQTLGRGMEKLWWAEVGYQIALDGKNTK
jgi:hypothetical protein